MHSKVIEFNTTQRSASIPQLQTGDIVKVYRKIVEGEKERIQVFEGMIIAIKGRQSSSPMMKVRKVSSGIGVELTLPMHSPVIDKIEIVKRAKVRKSKLYYIRDKSARSLKLKYQELAEFAGTPQVIPTEQKVEDSEKTAEQPQDAVVSKE